MAVLTDIQQSVNRCIFTDHVIAQFDICLMETCEFRENTQFLMKGFGPIKNDLFHKTALKTYKSHDN